VTQVPTYPDAGRCWQIVDKYKVSIFYTAPTAIRSMEKEGDRVSVRHVFVLYSAPPPRAGSAKGGEFYEFFPLQIVDLR
jgi:acyl-coenzyme A synthetase/AMP-(fatty) acid ligase